MPLWFWQFCWHIELVIEAVLLSVLWFKRSPRWFSILIGADFAASAFQLLLYRSHYPQLSRVIWIAGIAIAAPLGYMALIEADTMDYSGLRWTHIRILAAWIMAQLTCVSLQTQADLVIPINHILLTVDAILFGAWAALFVTSS